MRLTNLYTVDDAIAYYQTMEQTWREEFEYEKTCHNVQTLADLAELLAEFHWGSSELDEYDWKQVAQRLLALGEMNLFLIPLAWFEDEN